MAVRPPAPAPAAAGIRASVRARLAGLPPWAAPAGVAAGVLALGAFAAAVPPHGQGFYPRCPLYEATGVLCPGCGATRAVSALFSGHVATALRDNVLLVVALPLLALVWARWCAGRTGRPTPLARLRWPPAMHIAVPVVLVLYAVARNIPVRPFTLLAPV